MYTQIWNPITNDVHDSIIKRDRDGAFIPFDEGNKDYQEYLAWMEENEGNNPAPPEDIPEPPIEQPPPPDIVDLHDQVQDIDERLAALEATIVTQSKGSAQFSAEL
jgi:hypothetical protein